MTHGTPETGLARMRQEYAGELTKGDLGETWVIQFGRWLTDAIAADLPEPNAMVLATADGQGRPGARNVLLKGYDERGLVFYTNYDSRKGKELAVNPYASAVFSWLPLHRQVRVDGVVTPASREETEDYFAMRPRDARIGAWASPQSAVIASRADLDAAVAAAEERFAGTPEPPPRRTGAGTAWRPRRSNSGRGGRAACTTGCATAAPTRAHGSSNGSHREWAPAGHSRYISDVLPGRHSGRPGSPTGRSWTIGHALV